MGDYGSNGLAHGPEAAVGSRAVGGGNRLFFTVARLKLLNGGPFQLVFFEANNRRPSVPACSPQLPLGPPRKMFLDTKLLMTATAPDKQSEHWTFA